MRAWGIHCETAADAEEGLLRLRAAAADGEPFAVAVLDDLMPGADGEQLGPHDSRRSDHSRDRHGLGDLIRHAWRSSAL